MAGEEAGGCEWGWLGKRLVGVSGVGLVVSVCMQ